MKLLKTTMFLAGGILWLLFGAGFAILLWQFLTRGAGLQLFGNFIPSVSSGSVLFGFIYFVGLSMASVLCFFMGVHLWMRGTARNKS